MTLTCNATAVRNIAKLKWIDTANDRDLRSDDDGVLHISQPSLGQPSISTVLMLSVKNMTGEKWPKNVMCEVELEPERGKKHSETYYDRIEVRVTGKSLGDIVESCNLFEINVS